MNEPQIRKASSVEGKTLSFRDAGMADCPFILSLRLDEEKSRHLSPVSNELQAQQDWMAGYQRKTSEAYFIIEDGQAQPIGTVRLYDAKGASFCWGSWILVHGAAPAAAIESALMVYSYALDHLGFSHAHFQVHRANERVWAFHERFGARRVAEDEVQYHYELDHASILASRERYRRYLPGPVSVKGIAP